MALDPIIDAARIGWDKGDPWGSGMALLGAVCDLYTAVGFGRGPHHTWTDGTPPIPEEIGYRPAAALVANEFDSLAHLAGTVDAEGTPDYEWDDPWMWDVAAGAGFSLIAGETGADVVASDEDWRTAPDKMQRTMRTLHRYLNLVKAAGLDY